MGKLESILEKIVFSVGAVFKNYILKIFIYPFIFSGMYSLIRYGIENKLDLKYFDLFPIVLIVYLVAMMFELFTKKQEYPSDNPMLFKAMSEKSDERILELKAYHEAGHAVMAKILHIPIKEINIKNNGNIGGQVTLDMPNIAKSSEIKNLIMIRYSGFIAEKIMNNEASDGCMGSDTADMESSNTLLRKYIILTDESLSFTGYEEEYIKETSIRLSKEWLEEVKGLLIEHKDDIKNVANNLLCNETVKRAS